MADQIVRLRDDGKWELIGEGNTKATKLFDTQAEAVEYARKTASNQESGVIVYGKDGKVRAKTESVNMGDAKQEKKADKPAAKADSAKDKKAKEKAAKKKAKQDQKAKKKADKDAKKKAKAKKK